jgi:hypothetical protein
MENEQSSNETKGSTFKALSVLTLVFNSFVSVGEKIKTPFLAVFIVVSAILFFNYSQRFAHDEGVKYLKPLEQTDSLVNQKIKSSEALPKTQLAVLIHQNEVVTKRKAHHRLVFLDLYSYYYATIITFHSLTVISGVLVFVIVSVGWKDTTPAMRVGFLCFVGATTYYGLFPSIFLQKETIDKNLLLYNNYSNLNYQIYDYSLNPSSKLQKDKLSFEAFTTDINKKLVEYNQVYLGLDHGAIKSKDYLQMLDSGSITP